jgi:hypothetical protein
MPWKPSEPGERPTLGGLVLDWIEHYLSVVDGPAVGDPLVFTDEQVQFILRYYEVDPHFSGAAVAGRTINNGRIVRRAVLSRPKGWGKSPFVGAIGIVEAVGPVVMDGWDADGQPVGRPWWTTGIKPKVQFVANSEDQVGNTWDSVLDMVRSADTLLEDIPGIEPLESFINVPYGRIEPATSAGLSREGFRPVFCGLDQTEGYTESNGGWKLARTIRRNLAKVNGSSIETPNAFLPGEESVAEHSWKVYLASQEGRTPVQGMFYDHREAPPETDIEDDESLRSGLRIAYGDSAADNGGWVNLDRIMQDFYDTDEPQDARRYYLNQITHAADQWVSQVEWGRIKATYLEAGQEYDEAKPFEILPLRPGDAITIGFDGSTGRETGKADATALIGCRIHDGHLFTLGVWEAKLKEQDWSPPADEIDEAVRKAFREYRVMAMYADPSGWAEQVVKWEKDHGRKLRVKCSLANPMMAWPRGKGTNVIEHVERLRHAIVVSGQPNHEGLYVPECTHDGSLELTRHVLNARMRAHTRGYLIHKAFPQSPNKINAAYAAVMAYKARLDCVASGFGVRVNTSSRGRMMVLQ